MRAKSFTAKDIRAALEAVRQELGEDALILSSQPSDDGGLVVQAVVDELPMLEEAAETADNLESFDARHHRSVLARVRAPQGEDVFCRTLPFDRDTLFDVLCAERTPDMLAAQLTDAAEESGFSDMAMALARALDERMRTEPIDLVTSTAILLAGPMGAGKTNVAAKLAAEARLVGREVRLVATDVAGAGALARLEALAEPIGVAVVGVSNGEELADAFAAAAQEGALVIADTAGFDPRPKAAWREFLFLTRGSGEIVGVVSALTDALEASEIAQSLREFGATRLIVTGLDCARRRGTLVALATSGLAIAQVSHSPFLADGLSPLTPLALAREIASRAQPFAPAETVGAA